MLSSYTNSNGRAQIIDIQNQSMGQTISLMSWK